MTAFTPLDLAVLLAYLVGVTTWGAWLGRNQKGGRDYFLGGRELPWGAVLLSVVATETSTLTFLSVPGVSYLGALTFLQLAFGYLAGRIVVAAVLLPAYYRGEIQTAYALLEGRFGTGTRRFTSGLFMATRLMADSVRLFATSIPLALLLAPLLVAIGVAEATGDLASPGLPAYLVAILGIGVLTLIYTWAGGIRAVVWVDVVQMALYLTGTLAALWTLHLVVAGGWPEILGRASEAGKLQVIDASFDPGSAYTIWAGLLGGAFLSMASHGTDQLIVQRLLTCRDLRSSQKALIGSGVGVIVQFTLFLLIGLGLWALYEGREFARPDEIFSTFIVEELPSGLTGLLIAGVFAAAMSSLSSSINALASASTYDFWAPLMGRKGGEEVGQGRDIAESAEGEDAREREAEDERLLGVGRAFTVLWAALLIGGAFLFIPLSRGTAAVEVALGIASLVYGGLLGAFALGIVRPRTRPAGVVWGMAGGIGTVTVIWLLGRITPETAAAWEPGPLATLGGWLAGGGIAWPWYVVIGSVITFAIGSAFPRREGGGPDDIGGSEGPDDPDGPGGPDGPGSGAAALRRERAA